MNCYKVKGLLNTDVKRQQIHERLTDIVDEDENLTKFSKKLERLIKSSFDVDDVDNNNNKQINHKMNGLLYTIH